MAQLNHTGKRADKVSVDEDAVSNSREISEYTMTCPECGGDGRYDTRGDVICEDCGVVIAGPEDTPVIGETRKESAENTFIYKR